MSYETKLMIAIILLAIPTIEFGGYFLLQLKTGGIKLELTPFQKELMKSGHSHAGVLSILTLVMQPLLDEVNLSSSLDWSIRIGFLLSTILISGGFFGAAAFAKNEKPGQLIFLIYLGSGVLTACLIVSAIAYIRVL